MRSTIKLQLANKLSVKGVFLNMLLKYELRAKSKS
jgi:hypothetical protein